MSPSPGFEEGERGKGVATEIGVAVDRSKTDIAVVVRDKRGVGQTRRETISRASTKG